MSHIFSYVYNKYISNKIMELKKTNKYAHGIDKTGGTEDVFALIFTRWNNGRSVFWQKYYLLCHFSSPTYFIFEILCAPFGWCTIALKVFLLFLSLFFCSFCSLFHSQFKRIRNSCAHNSWARPSHIAGDLESEIKIFVVADTVFANTAPRSHIE